MGGVEARWPLQTSRYTLTTQIWDPVSGEPLGPGDVNYDQVPYVSGDVHYWIGLRYKLYDPGANLHYRGRDDDGCHVVGVTLG